MLRRYLADLLGWVPVALLAGWIASIPIRAWMGRIRKVELIPAVFLLAQVVHSSVFQRAGYIHAYWLYWIGPAMAVGGAVLIFEVRAGIEAVLARVRRSSGPAVAGRWPGAISAIAVIVITGPLAQHQARHACGQIVWGMATGSGSYQADYDDQHELVAWARALGRTHDRNETVYVLDPSVEARIEFRYYLDAPIEDRDVFKFEQFDPDEGKNAVLLADLDRCGARSTLAQLASRYRTTVWNGRLVSIESKRAGTGEVLGMRLADMETPWWARWLVSPTRPLSEWMSDDLDPLDDPLAIDVQISSIAISGHPGGDQFAWDCPPGHLLAGVNGLVRSTRAGNVLGAIQPVCKSVLLLLEQATGAVPLPDPSAPRDDLMPGRWYGDWSGGVPSMSACAHAAVPVGMYVSLNGEKRVTGVGMLCSSVLSVEASGTKPVLGLNKPYRSGLAGNRSGPPSDLACNPGSVAWGLRGRAGALVDSIGIACAVHDLFEILSTWSWIPQVQRFHPIHKETRIK